jgi:hypothetical protein
VAPLAFGDHEEAWQRIEWFVEIDDPATKI